MASTKGTTIMVSAIWKYAVVAAAALAAVGCTIKDQQAPPLSGPSGLALTLRVTAVPSSIAYGVNAVTSGEQTAVTIQAIGPDGRGIAQLPIRLNIEVDGTPQDYGTLRERNVVTAADGTASTTYTAPPIPAGGVFPNNCGASTLGTCVRVVATPTSNDFGSVSPESVQIRLVPTGVILPPADNPTASFTFSPSPASANVPVQFDASASTVGAGASNIASYVWTFGDGATGSGRSVSHTFAAGGTYTVRLTVTNDRGLTGTASQAVTVTNATAPTAIFSVSPTAPGVNQPVFFNAGASVPGQGHQSIVSYRWTFGDGTTGSGQTVSHTYTASGTYVVQLTVTDDSGATTTSTGTSVVVSAAAGGGTSANFSFSPAAPAVGDTVLFDWRNSTAAAGATITALDWNWGDATATVHCPGDAACDPSTGITSHVFQRAGTFNVSLQVTDSSGRTSLKTLPVAVTAGSGASGPPQPAFTFSPSAPAVGENVFFNGSTSRAGSGRTIVSYDWTFGDGQVGTGVTPVHSYSTSGTFAVQLRVTDDIGQSTTSAAQTISIGSPPAPTASFTSSPGSPAVGQTVVFDASGSTTAQGQTIVSFQWNFGDSSAVFTCPGAGACNASNPRIITHAFGASGSYTVNLIVTDSAGRTATTSKTVTVP
jgi:PKD repeat protein